MRKPIFYFISVFFISLSIYPWIKDLSGELINTVLIALIFILGVPHGAIDNLLMKRRTGWSNSRFYFFYLGLIILNIILWISLPALSLLLFLLISAYHFGQAQLSHHFQEKHFLKPLLYISWGTLILNAFFLFNHLEILEYFRNFSQLESIGFLFNRSWLLTFAGINLAIFSLTSWLLNRLQLLPIKSILVEYLISLMIFAMAFLFDFVFGFALFFILLHAVPVMVEEYEEFHQKFSWKRLFDFLLLLAPFSLISFVGVALLFALKSYAILDTSYLFLILITTSSITLPHVWVMKKFYRD